MANISSDVWIPLQTTSSFALMDLGLPRGIRLTTHDNTHPVYNPITFLRQTTVFE